MEIVSMVSPNCGASLQVDADQKNLACINYGKLGLLMLGCGDRG